MENTKDQIQKIIRESFKDTDYKIHDYLNAQYEQGAEVVSFAIILVTRNDEPIIGSAQHPKRALIVDFFYIEGVRSIKDFGTAAGLNAFSNKDRVFPSEDEVAVTNILNSINKKTALLRFLYKKDKEAS